MYAIRQCINKGRIGYVADEEGKGSKKPKPKTPRMNVQPAKDQPKASPSPKNAAFDQFNSMHVSYHIISYASQYPKS